MKVLTKFVCEIKHHNIYNVIDLLIFLLRIKNSDLRYNKSNKKNSNFVLFVQAKKRRLFFENTVDFLSLRDFFPVVYKFYSQYSHEVYYLNVTTKNKLSIN